MNHSGRICAMLRYRPWQYTKYSLRALPCLTQIRLGNLSQRLIGEEYKNKDVDDLGFDESRCKIDPQSGPNSDVVVVDTVADGLDGAAVVDTRSAEGIVAGRPQPPPAGGLATD